MYQAASGAAFVSNLTLLNRLGPSCDVCYAYHAGMALNGVNLPLAYTGQEKVYQKLYNKFGVSNKSLAEYFGGPAFLAWNRGQGLLAWVCQAPSSECHSRVSMH